MSEKKFSPEDVLKILRACTALGKSITERCCICPANNAGCSDFSNEVVAADAIEELLAEVKELRERLRWRSVEEELPDAELDEVAKHINLDLHWPGYKCLVLIKGATEPTILNYVDYDGDRVWLDDDMTFYPVTHWRKLYSVSPNCGEEG